MLDEEYHKVLSNKKREQANQAKIERTAYGDSIVVPVAKEEVSIISRYQCISVCGQCDYTKDLSLIIHCFSVEEKKPVIYVGLSVPDNRVSTVFDKSTVHTVIL